MLNYCRKHGLQVENNRNHFFPVPNTGLLLRARGFFFFSSSLGIGSFWKLLRHHGLNRAWNPPRCGAETISRMAWISIKQVNPGTGVVRGLKPGKLLGFVSGSCLHRYPAESATNGILLLASWVSKAFNSIYLFKCNLGNRFNDGLHSLIT